MKNKVLIALFLLALAGPTLAYPLLSQVIDTTNHENREYAGFPEMSPSNWKSIPSGIEAYYTDRIPFKNQFTSLNSRIERLFDRYKSNYEVFSFSDIVTEGREEWLYYTVRKGDTDEVEDSIGELLGTNLYDEEALEKLSGEYQSLYEALKDRGSDFLLLFTPGKEQVYPEYLPEGIPERLPEMDRIRQLSDYLQTKTDVSLLYPLDVLKKAKEECQIFYKYDTHWNYAGAFVCEQELMKALGQAPVPLSQVDARVTGEEAPNDLARLVGLADVYKDDDFYRVYGYKEEISVETVESREDGHFFHYRSDAPDKRKVLIVGDSFMAGINKYLPLEFGELWAVNDIEEAAQVYNQQKPDLVIFECAQRLYGKQEEFPSKFLENIR